MNGRKPATGSAGMSGREPATARVLLRRRRISLICGCLCSALAASIMAVPLPYYPIFAVAALGILLITWPLLLARTGAAVGSGTGEGRPGRRHRTVGDGPA